MLCDFVAPVNENTNQILFGLRITQGPRANYCADFVVAECRDDFRGPIGILPGCVQERGIGILRFPPFGIKAFGFKSPDRRHIGIMDPNPRTVPQTEGEHPTKGRTRLPEVFPSRPRLLSLNTAAAEC